MYVYFIMKTNLFFLKGKDGYLETWHHYSSVEMVNTDSDFISFVNIMYQFLKSYVCKVPS